MESVRVDYNREEDKINAIDGAVPEIWIEVCGKYNDDVHRVRDITDMGPYSGLYECIDDNNEEFYYIVEEDNALYKYKRRNVYNKLGL